MIGRKITRRRTLQATAAFAGGLTIGCGDDTGLSDARPADAARARDADASPDATSPDAPDAEADAGPLPDYRLPEGHFVPAKMAIRVIAPRPEGEIGAESTYLWAHEGVRYEVPIAVVGGAWPFRFEVIDGPMGMTIGSQLVRDGDRLRRPADYGVVRWTPPAGSEGALFSFTVRVSDQEGNVAEVEVNGTVDASRFVFVAPSDGSPDGDGTLAAPLRGFDALYRGISTDATYSGRHVYFREGRYELVGGSDANGNARVGGGAKPKVWRAYPDETPTFDCSTAKITFNGGGMDDACFAGLRFENGRQDVANAHFIWANTRYDRALFWRNHFHGLERGQNGNDNPAAIFLSAAGQPREHIAVLSNRFEAMGPGGGNGVAGYDSYGLDYSLFEDNTAARCRSQHCFWLKGGHRFTTVRGERLVDDNQAATVLLNISLGRDGRSERSESVEVSYCRAYSPSADSMRHSWASSASQTGPLWIYRCSIRGSFRALHSDTVDVVVERCLFTDAPPSGATTNLIENEQVAGDDFTNELALEPPLRARLLGTHGAEIA